MKKTPITIVVAITAFLLSGCVHVSYVSSAIPGVAEAVRPVVEAPSKVVCRNAVPVTQTAVLGGPHGFGSGYYSRKRCPGPKK